MVVIREIDPHDAAKYVQLSKKLIAETKFMLHEPGEGPTSTQQQQDRIQNICQHPSQTILVAEIDQAFVGMAACFGGAYQRNRRTVNVVVGVIRMYWGQGVGSALLSNIETWALQHDIHRLELTVMTHNAGAIHLYEKMGFQTEGKRAESLFVGGEYVDEYSMAKLLPAEVQ